MRRLSGVPGCGRLYVDGKEYLHKRTVCAEKWCGRSGLSGITRTALCFSTTAITRVHGKMIAFRTYTSGLLVLLALATSCGCAAGMHHLREDVGLKLLAKRAYKSEPASACTYPKHFSRGWKQAYYNVSLGADPCPPSIPPQPYWSKKYQDAEGCRKIEAWYAGYHKGVEAALRDCRPQYNKVPIGAFCERQSEAECRPTSEFPPTELNEVSPPLSPPVPEEANTASSLDQLPQDSRVEFSSFETEQRRLPPTEGWSPFQVPVELLKVQ